MIAALALLVAAFAPAEGGTVVLLRSSGAAPYLATAAAFRAAWRGPLVELAADDETGGTPARRLAELAPEVVVAVGLRAALLTREALPRTPLVHCLVSDPGRWQLAGPWVTGVAADVPPRAVLEALRAAAPSARRVGLLYGSATGGELAHAARVAAAALGVSMVEAPVADLAGLPAAARGLADRADALWLPADPTVASPEAFQFLLELSLARRKPLVVFSESLVRAGALLAVVPDYGWTGMAAAEAVRRVLSGERAGDVPLAAPTRTRVVSNADVARAIGATPAGVAP